MDATTNKSALYHDAIDDTEQKTVWLPLYNVGTWQSVDSIFKNI